MSAVSAHPTVMLTAFSFLTRLMPSSWRRPGGYAEKGKKGAAEKREKENVVREHPEKAREMAARLQSMLGPNPLPVVKRPKNK